MGGGTVVGLGRRRIRSLLQWQRQVIFTNNGHHHTC
jgi:hypothetical protein